MLRLKTMIQVYTRIFNLCLQIKLFHLLITGLKRVISSPRNIYPRTEFISGTRSPVTFYYSATCCDTSAKITAIDLLDNYNTYTIDVTGNNYIKIITTMVKANL